MISFGANLVNKILERGQESVIKRYIYIDKKDLIVVDNVQPHYGEPKAVGYAKVYDTVDDLKFIEAKHIIAKNEEPEEEPAEEDAEAEEAEE